MVEQGENEMKTPEQEIVTAAVKWFRGHRPKDWKLQEHIENPSVNLMSYWSEKPLALAVAKMLKQRKKSK